MNQNVDNQLGGYTVEELIAIRNEKGDLIWLDEADKLPLETYCAKGQSKRMSITETLLNTFAGMLISICAQVLIYPLFDIHVPLHTNVALCAIFTVISIIRSYWFRRFFNKLHEKGISL